MNIYFISDAHLGYPNRKKSLEREKKIVRWLDFVADNADEIWLLGDIFEFWFEWKKVVPRGFVRLLGKIAELCDKGKIIRFYTGNHDLWVFDYLTEELGVELHRKPVEIDYNGKSFCIAHGDGLGDYDRLFKVIKWFFTNRFFQWLLSVLHPNITIKMAYLWSKKSRNSHKDNTYEGGVNNDWLIAYSKEVLKKKHYDYFVYGHLHYPQEVKLNEKCKYVNLGEWVKAFTYGHFDGQDLKVKTFDE